MTIYSHVVIALNHDTGSLDFDDETLEAHFPDGDIFDSESNEWLEFSELEKSLTPKDAEIVAVEKELREKLEQSIDAYDLLREVFEEISVGDGEMSYDMFLKVRKFFGIEEI